MLLLDRVQSQADNALPTPQAPSRVLLPLARNGEDDARGADDSVEIEGQKPTATPTYDFTSEEAEFQPTLEYIRTHMDEFVQSGEVTHTEGEETRGGILSIAGHDIQMPESVIILAYVVNLECLDRSECPETPAITLTDTETDLSIFIEGPTGRIMDSNQTPSERFDEARQTFQWLYDAVAALEIPTPEATALATEDTLVSIPPATSTPTATSTEVVATQVPENVSASAMLATPTATPTHFIRTPQADIQKPQVTPTGEEHFVFQPMYLNMMFDTEDLPYVVKRIRWYTDSTIWADVLGAIADWNAIRPDGILDMQEASSPPIWYPY